MKKVAFFDMDGTIVAPYFVTNSGGGIMYLALKRKIG